MKTIQTFVARLSREWHERWAWYQAQRQVPRRHRWWDAYNT
jgi:hypothetical protein